MMHGQLVSEDRNEDQVVDAENDFHHDQGRKSRPDGGVDREADKIIHRSITPSQEATLQTQFAGRSGSRSARSKPRRRGDQRTAIACWYSAKIRKTCSISLIMAAPNAANTRMAPTCL